MPKTPVDLVRTVQAGRGRTVVSCAGADTHFLGAVQARIRAGICRKVHADTHKLKHTREVYRPGLASGESVCMSAERGPYVEYNTYKIYHISYKRTQARARANGTAGDTMGDNTDRSVKAGGTPPPPSRSNIHILQACTRRAHYRHRWSWSRALG